MIHTHTYESVCARKKVRFFKFKCKFVIFFQRHTQFALRYCSLVFLFCEWWMVNAEEKKNFLLKVNVSCLPKIHCILQYLSRHKQTINEVVV